MPEIEPRRDESGFVHLGIMSADGGHQPTFVHSARLANEGRGKSTISSASPASLQTLIILLQAFSNYVSSSDVSFPCGAEHLASLILDVALLRLHMKIIARQC
jgi:hypothetical protein